MSRIKKGIAVAILLQFGAAALLASQPPEVSASTGPGPFDNMGQMVLAGMMILSGIVTALVGLLKDRNAGNREAARLKFEIEKEKMLREWKLEDRRHAVLAEERLRQETGRISNQLEENTNLTKSATLVAKAAFVEANKVNQKIAEIGEVRRSGKPEDRKLEGA